MSFLFHEKGWKGRDEKEKKKIAKKWRIDFLSRLQWNVRTFWLLKFWQNWSFFFFDVSKEGNTDDEGRLSTTWLQFKGIVCSKLLLKSGFVLTKLLKNFVRSRFWMGCCIDKVNKPFWGNLAWIRHTSLKSERKIILSCFMKTTLA